MRQDEVEFYSELIEKMGSPKTGECCTDEECAKCRGCPCGVIKDPDLENYVSDTVAEFGGSDMLQWGEWDGSGEKAWMVCCPHQTLSDETLEQLSPCARKILGL